MLSRSLLVVQLLEHRYKLVTQDKAWRCGEFMNNIILGGALVIDTGRSDTDVSVGYGTIQLWQRDILILITLEDNVSVSWNIELYNASGN